MQTETNIATLGQKRQRNLLLFLSFFALLWCTITRWYLPMSGVMGLYLIPVMVIGAGLLEISLAWKISESLVTFILRLLILPVKYYVLLLVGLVGLQLLTFMVEPHGFLLFLGTTVREGPWELIPLTVALALGLVPLQGSSRRSRAFLFLFLGALGLRGDMSWACLPHVTFDPRPYDYGTWFLFSVVSMRLVIWSSIRYLHEGLGAVAVSQDQSLTIVHPTIGPARADGRCPVCNDPHEAMMITCPRCDTAHHRRCWYYIGGCSIYGCLEHVTAARHSDDAPLLPKSAK